MNFLTIRHSAKYKGIILILLAILARLNPYTLSMLSCEVGAVFGLFFVFFSNEKIEKETYPMLRFKALVYAIYLYFLGATFTSFYFLFFEKRKDYVVHFSAYEAIIIIFTISIGVFYYLKSKSQNEQAN